MTRAIVLLLLLLATTVAQADYVPSKIHTMILRADKVIYGEVSCVDDAVFEVKIKRSLVDEPNTLTIIKFKEWECGKRWVDYKVGQEAVFLLKISEDGYRTMGGGNEGELPVVNDKAFIYSTTLSMNFEKDFDNLSLVQNDNGYANPFYGVKIELDTLWYGIQTFRTCVVFETNTLGNTINAKFTCSEQTAQNFIKRDKVFAWSYARLFK